MAPSFLKIKKKKLFFPQKYNHNIYIVNQKYFLVKYPAFRIRALQISKGVRKLFYLFYVFFKV